jgi:hypothetical protein
MAGILIFHEYAHDNQDNAHIIISNVPPVKIIKIPVNPKR